LGAADYPFNTDHIGIRSLAAAVRAECLRTFERGARLAGATHFKGLPAEARSVPAAQSRPWMSSSSTATAWMCG
jgi:putative transposase